MSGADNGVTANELLAVMGARALRDNTTVFAGVGAPMMASGLAQRMHAPRLTMVIEGGIVGPMWKPGSLPPAVQHCQEKTGRGDLAWVDRVIRRDGRLPGGALVDSDLYYPDTII